MSQKYLPLFHAIHGQRVLVIGAGRMALRRCKKLLEYDFRITVVAPHILPELRSLLEQQQQTYVAEIFSSGHLENYFFVLAATDRREVNAQIATLCNQQKIPVNVVDDPAACDFIFPMVVDREPLSIAIASGGASPILSRLLKNLIEGLVPASYGKLAALVGRYRNEARQKIPEESQRVAFWESVLQGSVAEAMFSGKEYEADALLQRALVNPEQTIGSGEVYLIGAGPGDPGLLTLRAFRLIQQADVILHDRLVSKEILALARPETELVYVGKQRSFHAVPQQEINQLLMDYAKQGKRVARLKGGDPFIFGRGGEEIAKLAENHIPFQVIPGITAASGCAAYAGIPLTHRDHAQSVRFVAGQLKDGAVDLPWQELAVPGQTLVFYMGLNGLPTICEQLINHGAASDLPAALIERGTTADQRIHIGTLATLASTIKEKEVHSPTLLIVGSVVSLHQQLAWFK
jgi:uroporphyrin-III C-methyltransferase/precorrin-2 dehydrogenase/sirohydrochlorin ferrochelatase